MVLLTWQLHLGVVERGGGRRHAHAEEKLAKTIGPADEDNAAIDSHLPPQRGEIPRTIYLTSRSMNKVARERIQRMKNLHPGFSIEYYDDARGWEFISDEFGPGHADVFDRLGMGQHKADFLRYCLLFRYGGYYLDMDMFPIRSTTECVPANLSSTVDLVSELAGAKHCAAACDSTSPAYDFTRAWALDECQPCNHVHNGFMIARAGARVLRELIGFMIRNPVPFNNGWMPCTHTVGAGADFEQLINSLTFECRNSNFHSTIFTSRLSIRCC